MKYSLEKTWGYIRGIVFLPLVLLMVVFGVESVWEDYKADWLDIINY